MVERLFCDLGILEADGSDMKLFTIGGRKIPYGGVLGEPRSRKVKKGLKRSQITPTRSQRSAEARLDLQKPRSSGFCARFFAAKSTKALEGRNALVLGLVTSGLII